MLKELWSVLCQSSTIDGQSNNISLFNVFEQLVISENELPKDGDLKTIPITLQLVVLIKRDEKDISNEKIINGQLDLVSPSGKVLNSSDILLSFEAKKPRLRVVITLNSFPVSNEMGDYRFRLSYKDNKSETPILISETPFSFGNK